MLAITDNARRTVQGADGVESWFLRANHPGLPRSVWLKATLLCRPGAEDRVEAWCCLFDGDRTAAFRVPSPADRASIQGGGSAPIEINAGDCYTRLEAEGGRTAGAIGAGQVSWDLSFRRISGSLGDPLCVLPSRSMLETALPKGKLVTPFPVATFLGSLRWGAQRWDLGGWVGMQGHNWGPAHTPRYAWGQCVFLDRDGAPEAMFEGISARVKVGPFTSPLASLLTARLGSRELRYDRLLRLWRQRAELDFPEWRLRMVGADSVAQLKLMGRPERMVCLGYDNPDGSRGHCLNSKTSRARLELHEGGERLVFESEHGGALEFLQPEQEPRVQPVI